MRVRRAAACLVALGVFDVGGIHLLENDEREHRVGAEAKEIRGEAFPQSEHAFVLDHLKLE